MPRLSKILPSYRKHRRSGQAVVTLSGRDFYLGPYGTKASRQEYDRLIAEWLANGRRAPGTPVAESISVAELCLAFWKHAKSYYVKEGRPTSEQCGRARDGGDVRPADVAGCDFLSASAEIAFCPIRTGTPLDRF